MFYIDFLRRVHELLDPPTYLEIGVRHGASLALTRSASVGIDPAFELRREIPPGTTLFEETSDEYFDRDEPLEPLAGRPAALGFIDGMHLIEYALRDFINVERHADWTSVVVFDDIYPRENDWAARNRITRAWTGDVYKIREILARHRPDLICVGVDTEPTGLLLVLGLDPTSTVLDDGYDEIVLDTVTPDPPRVRDDVLDRRGAIDADTVLGASFWSELRAARAAGTPGPEGLRRLRKSIRRDLGHGVIRSPLRRLVPSRA